MKNTRENRSTKKPLYTARNKRRAESAKKVATSVFIVLVLGGLIMYGLYRPEVSIKDVQVSGTVVLKPELIEKEVLNEISGKYLYFIPKRNTFFFPENAILKKISEDFRRIDYVKIERLSLTKLLVRVMERPEHYLWCGTDFIPERGPDDDCYFIDSGGYVFSKAPYYSGSIFLEFYGPLSENGKNGPVGGVVLSEDKFREVLSFRDSLISLGLGTQKILIKTDEDYELYFSGGGKLLASGKNDLSKNIEYLELALAADPLKAKMEQNRDVLDYLDVRFGNKVYFKFK